MPQARVCGVPGCGRRQGGDGPRRVPPAGQGGGARHGYRPPAVPLRQGRGGGGPQWFQNPNFPIRAVFGPANFKSAVLFFGATYSENKKCSEIILYLILR